MEFKRITEDEEKVLYKAADEYRINEIKNKILISGADTLHPEDYIEISYQNKFIVVSEVHRSDSRVIIETPVKEKALIYARILCMRLFESLDRDCKADELRNFIKNNEIYRANILLQNIFSGNTYSIDTEDIYRISLISNEKRADVKYRNEYLVQDASLARAYGVLYNYSKKLEYIRGWILKINEYNLKDIKADEMEELYILGRIQTVYRYPGSEYGSISCKEGVK